MHCWATDALRYCQYECQGRALLVLSCWCLMLTFIADVSTGGKHINPERHRDGETTRRDSDTTYRDHSSTYLAIHNDQRNSILCADALQLQDQLSKNRPHSGVHPLIGHKLWCAAQRQTVANHELMQTVKVHELLILPCCFQAGGVCPRLGGKDLRASGAGVPWG